MFHLWDFILIGVFTIQAVILSYISDPKKKSLVVVFPFPFTIATISLGTQIDATHALGLVNLAIFTYGVRFLYSKVKLNIILSIVFFAAVYCLIGILASICRRLPTLMISLVSLMIIVRILSNFMMFYLALASG